MKIRNTYIGIGFLLLATYQGINQTNPVEPVLYACVGIGFMLMDAVKNPKLSRYKKILGILAWIFVISGLILFIALLRQDAYGL